MFRRQKMIKKEDIASEIASLKKVLSELEKKSKDSGVEALIRKTHKSLKRAQRKLNLLKKVEVDRAKSKEKKKKTEAKPEAPKPAPEAAAQAPAETPKAEKPQEEAPAAEKAQEPAPAENK